MSFLVSLGMLLVLILGILIYAFVDDWLFWRKFRKKD